jgi:hypothetical protein
VSACLPIPQAGQRTRFPGRSSAADVAVGEEDGEAVRATGETSALSFAFFTCSEGPEFSEDPGIMGTLVLGMGKNGPKTGSLVVFSPTSSERDEPPGRGAVVKMIFGLRASLPARISPDVIFWQIA